MTTDAAALSLAEQWVIEILAKYLELPPEQIWIRNQNKKIPNDKKLYVVVGMVDSRPYGGGSEVETVGITPPGDDDPYEEVRETVTAHVVENIQIDMSSRSNEAIKRRWEILHALNSIWSKQIQEKYDFKIARVPTSIVNASGAEGGSNLNRFTCIVPCLTMHKTEKVLESNSGQYYDDFRTRVDDEESIGTSQGIIEFEIDPDSDPP